MTVDEELTWKQLNHKPKLGIESLGFSLAYTLIGTGVHATFPIPINTQDLHIYIDGCFVDVWVLRNYEITFPFVPKKYEMIHIYLKD